MARQREHLFAGIAVQVLDRFGRAAELLEQLVLQRVVELGELALLDEVEQRLECPPHDDEHRRHHYDHHYGFGICTIHEALLFLVLILNTPQS
jgi:hypothetical protein